MKADRVYEILKERGVLAGMRGHFPPDIALPIAEALVDAGINVFELTMNSTMPLASVWALCWIAKQPHR